LNLDPSRGAAISLAAPDQRLAVGDNDHLVVAVGEHHFLNRLAGFRINVQPRQREDLWNAHQ
jgi:hypothetical protein